MKRILIMSIIAVLASLPAFGATTVELGVKSLLAPQKGFDDNDNIQVVLHGALPNACYSLLGHQIEKIDQNKIWVRQFAMKQTDGICADESSLPPHMQIEIPFTTEVSLGQLPMGEYEFQFTRPNGEWGSRFVTIAMATALSVDSLPYAAVMGANLVDVVGPTDEVEVTLGGLLNSSCTELDPDIKVEKINDVYVLLPTVKVKTGVMCLQVLIPFTTKVNLGKIGLPGDYLIHVRSMNGKSVNRVLEVAAIP